MNSVLTEQKQQAEVEQKRIFIAFLFSLLFHILLILGIAIAVGIRFQPWEDHSLEDTHVELTMEEPVLPKEEAPKPTYVETLSTQEQAAPPENADFESDKNTHAASLSPPTGTLPVPTQDGRESKSIAWEDRNFAEGEKRREEAVADDIPSPSMESVQPVQPVSPPVASQTPLPEPDTAQATVEAQPASTPSPATPSPTALALLDPPVRPSAMANVKKQQPRKEASPPSSPPTRPAVPGYQPETRTTRIQGGITNRGRPALNVAATPLGRYKRILSDAIGSRWYYYVNRQIDLVNIGTVQIRFIVDRNGKAHTLRVLSNTSNESFANVSLRSILEAKIPPIPDEVVENLQAGQLEVDYTFTILSN